MGLGQQDCLDLVKACALGHQSREDPLHAVDGPEQVHRRGPCRGQPRADQLKLRRKIGSGSGLRAQGAHCDAIGSRDADRRRSAHHHGFNYLGHLFIGGGEYIALLKGKLGLVDETDAFRSPLKSENHEIPV